jgi:hypothetical protein
MEEAGFSHADDSNEDAAQKLGGKAKEAVLWCKIRRR